MMTGNRIRLPVRFTCLDWTGTSASFKVSVNPKHFSLPYQLLKPNLPASNPNLKRRFHACALPDRFPRKTGSKVSIGSSSSNMDFMKLKVPVDSKQPHEPTSLPEFKIEDDTTWKDWLEYISEIETLIEEQLTLSDELDQCVQSEDFQTAAELKSKLDACEAKDVIQNLNNKLETAVSEENFEEAAKLRDEGLVGLSGWWVARGKDDPKGTLVYIHQHFSHYMGRIFRTSDLALSSENPEVEVLHALFGNRQEAVYDMSALALEVYLKEDGSGSVQHQPCLLRKLQDTREESNFEVSTEDSSDNLKYNLRYEYGGNGQPTVFTLSSRESLDSNKEFSMDESILEMEPISSAMTSTEESLTMDLPSRVPADIRWWDRNRFVLTSRDDLRTVDSEDTVEAIEKVMAERSISHDGETVEDTSAESKSTSTMDNTVKKVLTDILDKLYVQRLEEYPNQTEGEMVQDINVSKFLNTSSEHYTLESEMMFSKLPSDEGSGDLFSGYYLGAYGPHGYELLHLSRHYEDRTGREFVEARKITGDANVPAGEVTFWAYIGPQDRVRVQDQYPEHLGIKTKYSGKGKIADHGFQNPKWVQGDLLHFESWSAMASGQHLGFVWMVPNARKFLVLLIRVRLPQY